MAGKLFLAVILCLALTTAVRGQVMEGAYNVTQVCTMVKTGTQVGSTQSCDYYYACTPSGPVKKTCSAGFAYNYQTQNCAPASQVDCYYGVTNPCAGKTGNNWVPNVNNCQGWIYCVGEKASSSGSCNKGEIFNGAAQKCVYGSCSGSSQNTGPTSFNYCSVVPPNMYFGSTSNCKTWNYCSPQGALSSGECKSSAFIVSTGGCGYDTAPGACDRVVSAPVPTKCTEKGTTAGDPNVCGNYYICDGTNFKWAQCPTGTYYDVNQYKCITRKAASPTPGCNRCQYATTPFVNDVNHKTCNTYYYCNNGKNGDVSTCGKDSFFNENDQVCASISGLVPYSRLNGACSGATGETNPPSPSPGDNPSPGTPEEGTPEEGTPEEGTPEEGTPEEGTPEEGTPEEGTEEGTEEDGTQGQGK